MEREENVLRLTGDLKDSCVNRGARLMVPAQIRHVGEHIGASSKRRNKNGEENYNKTLEMLLLAATR